LIIWWQKYKINIKMQANNYKNFTLSIKNYVFSGIVLSATGV
jgi:uncharacterized Tic20 family protein